MNQFILFISTLFNPITLLLVAFLYGLLHPNILILLLTSLQLNYDIPIQGDIYNTGDIIS